MQICEKILNKMQLGLVILAAGRSERMGFTKQNVVFKDKTMLQHLLHEALMSDYLPITVVVGANKKDIVPNFEKLPITIIDNPKAQTGMGSSIKMGLIGTYMTEKNIEGILFMTSDMPLIKTSYLKAMAYALENEKDAELVVSRYGGSLGIPALFRRSLFEEILLLKDENGAKGLIEKHTEKAFIIDFPEGEIDLDTPADIDNFRISHPHFFTNPA
jgi:molybdenum cofactor cytidylyltransferase